MADLVSIREARTVSGFGSPLVTSPRSRKVIKRSVFGFLDFIVCPLVPTACFFKLPLHACLLGISNHVFISAIAPWYFIAST